MLQYRVGLSSLGDGTGVTGDTYKVLSSMPLWMVKFKTLSSRVDKSLMDE